MSRIRVTVDRLVLKGIAPLEARALTDALHAQLSHVLANHAQRGEWARSHRTPLLSLAPMPLASGTAGAARFGRTLAGAVAQGVKR